MSAPSPARIATRGVSPVAVSDRPALQSGRREGWIFRSACGGAAWFSVIMLAVLLGTILWMGAGRLRWSFIANFDSLVDAEKAGVLAGLWGSAWLMLLTTLAAVPIGVGAAIYLEEYAVDGWLTRLIRINLANLAGVPSIVYGILGLTVFVRAFGIFDKGGLASRVFGSQVLAVHVLGVRIPLPLGETILAGALTLSLLVLPVVIVASQEALRAVPSSIREASLALGATRWQTIRHQLLPASIPGILTGVILALSRAVGETAPLVMVGAAVFFRRAPGGITNPITAIREPSRLLDAPFDDYTALPMIIYNWAKQPLEPYQQAAAAGIIVLLASLLLLNALAIFIRNRYQKASGR